MRAQTDRMVVVASQHIGFISNRTHKFMLSISKIGNPLLLHYNILNKKYTAIYNTA